MTPYFSIIIPMFNREQFVARTLKSCLCQSFDDFEIIVVDDGSNDNSIEAVRAFTDPRIRLIVHESNRGVCPARNTGIDAAKAEWIICLDSDDELTHGGLAVIQRRTLEVEEDIGQLRFMCRLDSGELSPAPPLQDEVWDYRRYIESIEQSLKGGKQETLSCRRKTTFKTVRFPDGRALETLYHLDFAKAYITRTCPDVVRQYHQDAENQLVRPDVESILLSASDQAKAMEQVIRRHGKALARWAPKVHQRYLSGSATLQFLSGHRLKGLWHGLNSLKQRPFSVQIWAVILVGLLGSRTLAWLKTERSKWRSKRFT